MLGKGRPGRPSLEDEDGSEAGDELDVLLANNNAGAPHRLSLDSISPILPLHGHGYHRRTGSAQPERGWLAKTARTLPSRYLNWFRNTATLLLIVYTGIALFALYWVARFFMLRHDAYAHSVFSTPMIPEPHDVEPTVPALTLPTNPSHHTLQAALDFRLHSVGLPASTLPCTWTVYDETRFASLKQDGPYFFALNLYNNEVVFPTLARTLLTLAEFLGRQNVAISIFENGSRDNTTVALAHFAATLTAGGVRHTIVSDDRKTDWKKVDRIAQLSVYRNVALQPLNATDMKFQDVVFINDVFFCPRDALELLHQKRYQQADAACAMDWRATNSWLAFLGFSSVKYYDNWVGRSITGDMFRSRFDILAETRDGVDEIFDQPGAESSRARFQAALPTPVYSCWNGMLAISAAPFRGDNGPAISFRSAFNVQGECAASECKTVARDFWKQGLRRWLVVPSVHVTYAQDVYTHPTLVGLTPAARAKKGKGLLEKIDWSTLKPPSSVVCYDWVRGFHLDLPYRRSRLSPYRR